MTISLYTLGCKLNQAETEAMAERFKQYGGVLVPFGEPADLIVVNTCTVTSKSEQKARRVIRKASRDNPESAVLVTGCYAQMEKPAVEALAPRIVAVGMDDKPFILDIPEVLSGEGLSPAERLSRLRDFFARKDADGDPFRFDTEQFSYHSRAFLKIQDGCDNLCSYCRVRLARGRSVSLDEEEVLRRSRHLGNSGIGEIVLTGVNIDSYRCGDTDLPALIIRILRENPGIRLRLSSLNPESVTPAWAEALSHPRLCPHFHLALQSGSMGTLMRMRRNYTPQVVRDLVASLRTWQDRPFIAADIIAGFPGETEEEFSETVALLKELEINGLHVFPFSSRPGTEAAELSGHIRDQVIRDRVNILAELGTGALEAYRNQFLGTATTLILENSDTVLTGISPRYLRFPVKRTSGDSSRFIKAVLQKDSSGHFLFAETEM